MIFWIINIFLLITIGFLFLLLSMFWPPDSPWAPWWRTNKKVARAMCKLANVGKGDIVYDLGCGDGTALSIASNEFGASGFGIEIDPLRYLFSKTRFKMNRLSGKVVIVRKNFFDIDISKASVIFVYLVPRVLRKLKPKFLKELSPGSLIISYKYKMDLPLEKYDGKNDIYLYRISNI